jgi:aspartate aminotransferase
MPAPLPLATRLQSLQPSPIVQVAAQARALKAAGHEVLSLSIGVPGFLPPAHVYAAAHAAVDADTGDYLAGRGSAALVGAFLGRLSQLGFDYAESEVCAQVGGKGALFNLMLALLNPGDEVVIPAPYWTSYPEMVRLVGGVPVTPLATAAQDYKLTPAQLQAALTPRTKMVILNNPSNPTGMLYDAAEMAALAKVLAGQPGVWVVADDIYDMLTLATPTLSRAAHVLDSQPALKPRTVLVHSVSKTYGMPGWRVGMVAGPKPLIDGLLALSSQSFTHLPAVPMAAAAAALSGPQDFLLVQKERLLAQRDVALEALRALQWPCPVPAGAFYVFPQVRGLFGRTTAQGRVLSNDVVLCEALLAEALVAVVPGSAFGDDGAIRMSFAGPRQELVAALDRLIDWQARLI